MNIEVGCVDSKVALAQMEMESPQSKSKSIFLLTKSDQRSFWGSVENFAFAADLQWTAGLASNQYSVVSKQWSLKKPLCARRGGFQQLNYVH